MGETYEADFRIIAPHPDITGDGAGKEPGTFQFISARVAEGDLNIALQEVAYLYVDIPYRIGSTSYSRLSWNIVGPALIATPEGIAYSIADYIRFSNIPQEIRGTIYVKSILS